ncbi:MAG: IclR family transcriptional regulator, partial [Cocleimonas sp.]
PRIQVIDRAVALLDAISRYPDPVRLKVLSAETGLHTSTTHRILNSLIDNGIVEKEPSGHYRLGMKLLQMNVRLHTNIDLRSIALPFMEKLRDTLNESVNLTIREGDVLIYIEKAVPDRKLHVQQLIGSRAPLHVTAVGKMILGAAGKDDIISYTTRTNLPAYTRSTLSDPEVFLDECLSSYRQGFGLDNEEAEIDVGCIGTLIYDSTGSVVGGLSVSAPIERRKISWVDDVTDTAKEISTQLGYK